MTSPKRILLILVEPPLPFGNAAGRWFHVLYHQLLKNQYDVHVLVASGVEKDIKKAKELYGNNKNFEIYPFHRAQGLLRKWTSFMQPHKAKFDGDFKKALKKINPDQFDVIHVEQTWAGWATMPWAHKTLLNVHYLQSIDLKGQKAPSFKDHWLYKRYFTSEKKIISRYPFIRTVSDRLEDHIKQWGFSQKVQFIPLGIDPQLYEFIKEKDRPKRPIVSLIGNMTWSPSVSAAHRLLKHLWPTIKAQRPDAVCRIIGWNARSALKEYLSMEGVEILENVPDIKPYFKESSLILYAPKSGSGMKIKISEAMLFGIPVVTTSEGAEGLSAQDMIHCGVSDANQGLIHRTLKVLDSTELQNQMRENARTLIEDLCSPEKTFSQIEEYYKSIIQQNS